MKFSILFYSIAFIFINDTFSQNFELVGPPNKIDFFYRPFYALNNNPDHLFIGNTAGALISIHNDGTNVKLLHPGYGGSSLQIKVLESDTNVIFFVTGIYLLRTSDYGKNWASLDRYYDFIAVNPKNNNIVYRLDNNQILKSFDKGVNWQFLFQASSTFRFPNIEVAVFDTSIIYAATDYQLYKSTNSGEDWILLNESFSEISRLFVNPYNSSSVFLFSGKCFKSIDGGYTFNAFGPDFVSDFSIHPNDTSTFYFVYNDFFHFNAVNSLMKSTDNGISWFYIGNGIPKEALVNAPFFNPNNSEELYLTSEAGQYKSTNGGTDWSPVFLAADPVFDFYIDPTNPEKIITVPGSGLGFWMTTNSGESWFIPQIDTLISPRYGNVYNQIAFNPTDPNYGYVASDTALLRTTDGGVNWLTTFPYYNWLKSIAYSPANPNIILTCGIDEPTGGAKLFRSTDGGLNWFLIKDLVAWYNGITKIIFHPTDVNIVVGITRDSVIKSTDQGTTWRNINNGLISSQSYVMLYQSQLWMNPNNPQEMYVTQRATGIEKSGGLSMTTNGGGNWFQIDSSLKAIDYWCSATGLWVDPENTNRIYVGLMSHSQGATYTNGGIYFTDNHGKSWIKIFDSYSDIIKADNLSPRTIYFNTSYGLLRIKDTLVTSINDDAFFESQGYMLFQNYPNPFNPTTVINYSVKKAGLVKLKLYDILGRIVATLVNEEKSSGNYSLSFNASNLTSGVYIYQLSINDFVSSKKLLLLK